MTKVVVSGYYGFGNAGDELVLLAIVQQLRSVQPSVEITVLSGDPDTTAAQHGVRAVHRYNPFAVAGALRRSDLLISGGGSLLQDVTSRRTVPYYLGVISLAQTLGVPVFCYAQGIGPLVKHDSRERTRKVLSKVSGITVRDPDSAVLLREIGVRGPSVEVTADPVFGLATSHGAAGDGGALAGLPGPRIAFAMRPWPARPGWKDEVAGAARRCAESLGGTLVWVALHPPGDVELAEELSDLAGVDNSVLMAGCAPAEWPALFSTFDLVVGMRLHALIVAAACGKPFVGLSYDPKVESLLRQFGQVSPLRVGETDQEALFAEIRRAWELRTDIVAANAETVSLLRAAAAKTARESLSCARNTHGKRGKN